MPESPKFVLGQGDKSGAYEILRQMHRINTRNTEEFEIFDIYEELESIENRKRIMESKKSRFPLLTTVWIQTAPLFTPPYLSSTILVCTIQFGIYATSNGFYMFFTDILNRMATNLDNFVEPRISMCEIINMKTANRSAFHHENEVSHSTEITTKIVVLIIIVPFRFVLLNLNLKLLNKE